MCECECALCVSVRACVRASLVPMMVSAVSEEANRLKGTWRHAYPHIPCYGLGHQVIIVANFSFFLRHIPYLYSYGYKFRFATISFWNRHLRRGFRWMHVQLLPSSGRFSDQTDMLAVVERRTFEQCCFWSPVTEPTRQTIIQLHYLVRLIFKTSF